MFSREDVAAFINRNFEPAWEMVRPVPIVRIDFGNGNVATRTLHGNIASYVCATDGKVVDILPGIYTPTAYTAALEQPRTLAEAQVRLSADARQTRLRDYHREKARLLRNAQAAIVLAEAARPVVNRPQPARADPGKKTIERPAERIFLPPPPANGVAAPRPRTASELATWQPLVADTARNESERRLLIHDRLATTSLVQPEQIKRWLYKDVLHADLDDPYLGLGDDFFTDFEP